MSAVRVARSRVHAEVREGVGAHERGKDSGGRRGEFKRSRQREYPARAVSFGGVALTNKNIPVVAVDFLIAAGPLKGQTITWFGYMSSKEMTVRVVRSLVYAGWRGRDAKKLFAVTKTGKPRRPAGLGEPTVLVSVVTDSFRPDPTEDDPRPKISRRRRILFVNKMNEVLTKMHAPCRAANRDRVAWRTP